MPIRDKTVDIDQDRRGLRGHVPMQMHLTIRFDYGQIIPWVRDVDGALVAVAGPGRARAAHPGRHTRRRALDRARVHRPPGQRVPFVLALVPVARRRSRVRVQRDVGARANRVVVAQVVEEVDLRRRLPEAVQRSVITLKALTYAPTGGIVAAPTTSLPEWIGSVRNWDYRFCWLRDATFTLLALIHAGYEDEAKAWREWLLRAVAGEPDDLQIMYGPAGERRLTEWEVPWLPGYEGSKPVRVGNAASEQFQLDVYGEVIDALYQSRRGAIVDRDVHALDLIRGAPGFPRGRLEASPTRASGRCAARGSTSPTRRSWRGWRSTAPSMVRRVRRPEGDRPTPPRRLGRVRDEIHAEVCAKAYDADRKTFVQAYGSSNLDAALLMMPLVGFLPATDERMQGTVAAIQRELTIDGFVQALHDRERRRRAAAGRGRVPPVHVLARRQPRADGARRRGTCAVRTADRAGQRRRPPRRGVRPRDEAAARQLPAGVHARRAGEQRLATCRA